MELIKVYMIHLIRQNNCILVNIVLLVRYMKKKFITKKSKRKRRYKFLFFLCLFILGLYLSFKILNRSSIEITDKTIAKFMIDVAFENKIFSNNEIFWGELNPVMLLENNYYELIEKNDDDDSSIRVVTMAEPLIYIYNSHQTEEYSPSTFAEFSVNPTVMVADYILSDIFTKNNLGVIVEERSIKSILNQNNWKYSYSYAASRILMEDAKNNNPTLTYFIDVHRDSLVKDKTTITIDGKDYAKTIFLIGLENPNYEENLQFTTLINDKMNEKYPGLSKGIYKKGGEGVNGIYNQDFSNRTILIEIGGYESNLTEVLNSVIAFSECFMEVINGEI